MDISEELLKLQDLKYRDFSASLIPNIPKEIIIGVRKPELRKLAREINKRNDGEEFLKELPHHYNDEYELHGIIISGIKDYDRCITELDRLLPYIDNWDTCDIINPKCFAGNNEKLIDDIYRWIESKQTYTVRFAIKMLMTYYLDDNYKQEYSDKVANIRTDEYYLRMMIAWYFATALSKQYSNSVKYLHNNELDVWTHNKTIQKAVESYRITEEQKEYLKTLRR